jgi:hypothetical protein
MRMSARAEEGGGRLLRCVTQPVQWDVSPLVRSVQRTNERSHQPEADSVVRYVLSSCGAFSVLATGFLQRADQDAEGAPGDNAPEPVVLAPSGDLCLRDHVARERQTAIVGAQERQGLRADREKISLNGFGRPAQPQPQLRSDLQCIDPCVTVDVAALSEPDGDTFVGTGRGRCFSMPRAAIASERARSSRLKTLGEKTSGSRARSGSSATTCRKFSRASDSFRMAKYDNPRNRRASARRTLPRCKSLS